MKNVLLHSLRDTPEVVPPLHGVVQHGEVRGRDVAVGLNIAVELWAPDNVEEGSDKVLVGDRVVGSTEGNDPAQPIGSRCTSEIHICCQLCGRRSCHRQQPSRVDIGVPDVDFVLELIQDASAHIRSESESRCCLKRKETPRESLTSAKPGLSGKSRVDQCTRTPVGTIIAGG